jgi:hypothetical protein
MWHARRESVWAILGIYGGPRAGVLTAAIGEAA